MEIKYITPELEKTITDRPSNIIYVSYSQFSSFAKCPKYWELCYIKKIKQKEESIHTIFGTAMHTVIQEWIKILYTETVKKSNEYNFEKRLLEEIKTQYKLGVEKNKKHFSTKEELTEFYTDGLETLNYLRKKRTKYFDRKNEELVGIEFPLNEVLNGVCFIGFLDLFFRNKKTGRYIIKDLKTSTRGWSDYEKKDPIKVSQLILYKLFIAEKLNISVDLIDVEYVILKRKVSSNVEFPIPRVSTFRPASGVTTQNKTKKAFDDFITGGFIDGKYNTERKYEAKTGKNNFNCRFCEFVDNEELCPKSNRICE